MGFNCCYNKFDFFILQNLFFSTKVIEAFDELIESKYYTQNEELLEPIIIMYFEDT